VLTRVKIEAEVDGAERSAKRVPVTTALFTFVFVLLLDGVGVTVGVSEEP